MALELKAAALVESCGNATAQPSHTTCLCFAVERQDFIEHLLFEIQHALALLQAVLGSRTLRSLVILMSWNARMRARMAEDLLSFRLLSSDNSSDCMQKQLKKDMWQV